MLEFLKKIFQDEKTQGVKTTEISLQNADGWLSERSKPWMEETQQHVEDILIRVNEELQKTRTHVEILENAKLQNPNIPFKAKQYMEGNRKSYIKAINSFLGHMEINNKDCFYLLNFCKFFDESISSLNKSTLRSYMILQEFFANETKKIAQNLKNFDDLFKGLKSELSNERIAAANNSREKIQSLKTKLKQKINLDVELKDSEASLIISNNEKDKIISDIEEFRKSDDHNDFSRLNDEKKSKATAFYHDKNQLLQSFSILERALRKYSHIAFEHEEIVLSYLKEPINTLVNDKELKILDILDNLEKTLNDNKLQIDAKKREKSIEEIKKLGKGYLEQFIKKYLSFKKEMDEIENKIIATGVAEKLKSFNNQLEDVNLRIERNNDEYNRLKNDAERINVTIANLKRESEDYIQRIFGEEVKIMV
ncbi:MAG: hypothetical protein AABX33_03730 [Nanoarchaeota archaeon]